MHNQELLLSTVSLADTGVLEMQPAGASILATEMSRAEVRYVSESKQALDQQMQS